MRQRDAGGGDLDRGEERVVAGWDGTEVLQFVEEARAEVMLAAAILTSASAIPKPRRADMQPVAVDQRAVDVEQDRLDHDALHCLGPA